MAEHQLPKLKAAVAVSETLGSALGPNTPTGVARRPRRTPDNSYSRSFSAKTLRVSLLQVDTCPGRQVCLTLGDDLGHRAAEVFTIACWERGEKMVEFLGCLGVEGSRCPAAGVGECHVKCAPVTGHRRSPDKAALFGSVHKSGEGCLLHTEALCQFSHSSGAKGQDAYQFGLNRSEVMALGDARIDALHQAAKLNQSLGRVEMLPALLALVHRTYST
jgi:hypothetical protein